MIARLRRRPQEEADEYRYPSAVSGSQRLVAGFALIITIGTLLLRLPMATQAPGSLSWLDALFTSTSAVTVTGLTVISTANSFTLFGQIIILLLMQVGGVGFIALSVVLFRLAGRRVTMQERFMLRQTLGMGEGSNVLRLTRYVLVLVVGIEGLGALLLFARWAGTMPLGQAAYLAIFHSVSAFCNAGFDLYAGTDAEVLFGYGTDPYTLAVLALLIIIGGFGIVVMDDLITFPRDRRMSVHTKLTLVMTLALTPLGFLILLLDNHFSNTLVAALPFQKELVIQLFTVISARTAGITILPIEGLSQGSQLILMIWMFIGGAPSSMAGGVSTSTVAVIAVAMLATVRGQPQAVAFQRSLPLETILKAVAVMTISTIAVVVGSLLLVLMRNGDLFEVGFEAVSAFSNTGYSLGLTDRLNPPGRLLIAFLMFWGRLGPLTLVVILAQRQHPSRVSYPDEQLMLG